MPWQQLITDGCKNVFEWGPGLLLAVIILFGIYKILLHFGKEVGVKIINALEKPAEALDKQARSMDKLTGSIQDYVDRDQFEHKEMKLMLKVIVKKLNRMAGEVDDGS